MVCRPVTAKGAYPESIGISLFFAQQALCPGPGLVCLEKGHLFCHFHQDTVLSCMSLGLFCPEAGTF